MSLASLLNNEKKEDLHKIQKDNIENEHSKVENKDSKTRINKDKPILEVISPDLKISKKEKSAILENVKEKSLHENETDKNRPKLSSDSIKKLKEKIIGKGEKDSDKSKLYFYYLLIYKNCILIKK